MRVKGHGHGVSLRTAENGTAKRGRRKSYYLLSVFVHQHGGMNTPSLAIWRISVIMRGLRQDKGISLRTAADMLGTNKNRLDRTERPQVQKVDPGIITGWAFKYGAPEKVILELDALAMQTRDADANGWEDVFATMPKWFSPFLTLEKEAVTIDSYEITYIPGLLQVQRYMERLLPPTPS